MMITPEEARRRENRVELCQVSELVGRLSRGELQMDSLHAFVESRAPGRELKSPIEVLAAFLELADRDRISSRDVDGFLKLFPRSLKFGAAG